MQLPTKDEVPLTTSDRFRPEPRGARHTGARRAAVPLLVAALLAGCHRRPSQQVYDLAADAPLASQAHPGGVRTYVAPPATIYAGEGGSSRLVSTVLLEWADPAPRTLVLDLERPRWGSGEAAVTLDRTALGKLRLKPGRASYAVLLPAEAQRRGRNRVRLTFLPGATGERPPPAGPPPRLRSVGVGGPGEALAPRAVDVRPAGEGVGPVLVQAAGTRLDYAVRLPEAAEIRFTPRVGETEAPSLVFAVEAQPEGRPQRELFRVTLEKGEASSERRVSIPGEAGGVALLSLLVQGDARASGEWVAPRVMGRPPGPTATPDGPPSARLSALRRRLGDAGVLLIVLDAAGARHFGCYGYERQTTPEIDRLAAEAAVFDRAYTPASYTRGAMSSVWTGRQPEQHHHGVPPIGALPAGRVVLAGLLREGGVPTVAFVGNPNAGEPAGLMRGFTEARSLYLDERGHGRLCRAALFPEPVGARIARASRGPFLLYAHFVEPHYPYDPPPPFDTEFGPDAPLPRSVRTNQRWIHLVSSGRIQPTAQEMAHLVRLYDGNLASADHEIGRLRAKLESEGRWDHLLVIVTADHGEALMEHGTIGHGAQVYEESVKIPLIVKLPGRAAPMRIEQPVDLIDLGATLADVFGVREQLAGPGRSLLPLLVGEPIAPRTIVARSMSERPDYAWYDGWLKLVHEPRWGGTELYDLRADPTEQRDLSGSRPVRTEYERQSLYRWLRDLDRGAPAGGAEPLVTPETREVLRALGYVD
jgi:arylsulfatase A-like enzyme